MLKKHSQLVLWDLLNPVGSRTWKHNGVKDLLQICLKTLCGTLGLRPMRVLRRAGEHPEGMKTCQQRRSITIQTTRFAKLNRSHAVFPLVSSRSHCTPGEVHWPFLLQCVAKNYMICCHWNLQYLYCVAIEFQKQVACDLPKTWAARALYLPHTTQQNYISMTALCLSKGNSICASALVNVNPHGCPERKSKTARRSPGVANWVPQSPSERGKAGSASALLCLCSWPWKNIGHFGAENGFAIGTIEALQAMVIYQAPAYTSQLSFSWHEQVILGGRSPCQKSHQCVHICTYSMIRSIIYIKQT